MKTKLFLVMLATLLYFNGSAQINKADSKKHAGKDSAEMVFVFVEEMPVFPGGEAKFYDYLKDNKKYPQEAISKGIKGVVYVTFVVNEEGDIEDTKVLRGIGGGCDEEALRVIKEMPKWKPGKQNGRVVKVQYNVPFKFGVD